ncbi:hypothetical protein D3C71_1253670 [compost metagenome]
MRSGDRIAVAGQSVNLAADQRRQPFGCRQLDRLDVFPGQTGSFQHFDKKVLRGRVLNVSHLLALKLRNGFDRRILRDDQFLQKRIPALYANNLEIPLVRSLGREDRRNFARNSEVQLVGGDRLQFKIAALEDAELQFVRRIEQARRLEALFPFGPADLSYPQRYAAEINGRLGRGLSRRLSRSGFGRSR